MWKEQSKQQRSVISHVCHTDLQLNDNRANMACKKDFIIATETIENFITLLTWENHVIMSDP